MSITYKDAQELACLPEVHEALQNFFDNGSEDDAVCLIMVIEASLNPEKQSG